MIFFISFQVFQSFLVLAFISYILSFRTPVAAISSLHTFISHIFFVSLLPFFLFLVNLNQSFRLLLVLKCFPLSVLPFLHFLFTDTHCSASLLPISYSIYSLHVTIPVSWFLALAPSCTSHFPLAFLSFAPDLGSLSFPPRSCLFPLPSR